jgi:uncharacterized cupin superfamily protein
VTSIEQPVFDEPREHPGFTCRRARLGRQAGTERTGLSLWEVPPGQAAYPYHWHVAEEELIVVLTGTLALRAPDGWRELEQGEVVAFPVGEAGAHQLVNHGDQPVRFLSFSNQQPDLVMYPDSDKVGVFERRADGSGFRAMFRVADAVEYHHGEVAP